MRQSKIQKKDDDLNYLVIHEQTFRRLIPPVSVIRFPSLTFQNPEEGGNKPRCINKKIV